MVICRNQKTDSSILFLFTFHFQILSKRENGSSEKVRSGVKMFLFDFCFLFTKTSYILFFGASQIPDEKIRKKKLFVY